VLRKVIEQTKEKHFWRINLAEVSESMEAVSK